MANKSSAFFFGKNLKDKNQVEGDFPPSTPPRYSVDYGPSFSQFWRGVMADSYPTDEDLRRAKYRRDSAIAKLAESQRAVLVREEDRLMKEKRDAEKAESEAKIAALTKAAEKSPELNDVLSREIQYHEERYGY